MTSADEESIEEIAAGFDDKSESTSPELVRKVRFLAGAGHTPTVIIAHRERWFREALVALFANDGWAAMETHSAGELTELVRAIYPHVALVDPALLELSGSAASELLRAHRADNSLRVVALLGEVDPSANLEELTSGYDDFVYHLDNPAEVVVRARRNLAACRATRESHQQRSDLSSLLQLSQTLASSLDLNLILHTVSRLLAEVIEFERCSIVLLDPEGQGALMVAASEDRTVRDLRIAVSNYPEMQRCIETGRPVYVDESVSEVELLPLVEKMRASGVRLAALFPIIFEERVTGVLFLRSSIGGRTLTEREKRYGQTVASACAVAVRNARLFDSVRDQHERMNSMRLVAERQMEALKRYEDFFEYAADGMAIVDSDGAILYVNREGRRAIGRQQEELRGVRFASLMVGESTNMWERIIEQVREGRFRRSFDLYIQHGDGSERIFWLSAGGVGQDTGLIVLSFRDVTETREMELELRTTKEFLENLIDNSVDAIVAADMSGNVMLFNKGAEQIFGYHAEEVVGRLRLEQLYPHGVVEEVMTQLRDERFGGRGRLDGSRKSVLDSRG
ncbi:MAG: PAS domain S-box protein, partial [Myxococcota bacterium]